MTTCARAFPTPANARPWTRGVSKFAGRLGRDRRGGTALVFALAVPALAILAAGGMELAFLVRDRGKMQSAADAAVLAAASQMTITDADSAVERAKSYAAQQLTEVAGRSTVTFDAQSLTRPNAIKIDITSHRLSFFGNLLPPGGFTIRVTSTAQSLNSSPLCVLTHGEGPPGAPKKKAPVAADPADAILQMDGTAVLKANDCLVHSNGSINVKAGATLMAERVQSVKAASGVIQPSADTGAPSIADPFQGVDFTPPSTCPAVKGAPKIKLDGFEVLQAGVHCQDIILDKTAQVTMAPGEHYFMGDLRADGEATLTGADVVLLFDDKSKFDFKGNAKVALRGRKSGPLAGFVVVASRDNDRDFRIESDHVSELLGTLYVPSARLMIDGKDKVAQASAWTVVVAYMVKISKSASLVVNANYSSTPVPVPQGVGPNRGAARLSN